MTHFLDRRRTLLTRLGDGVAVIPTATPKRRNGDTDYRFRPDSDFLYLTGFREPDALLVLIPGREEGEQVLFLQPREPEQETWTGRRLGVERAREVLGVDQAFPIGELEQRLPALLAGPAHLYCRTGLREDLDRTLLRTLATLRTRPRRARAAPEHVSDLGPLLHEMRLFKDAQELRCMRRAADISVEAHAAAMAAARPGVHEYEVEALLESIFRSRGGDGPAYPSIVASGPNATILHHVRNDRRIEDGDLVLIDAGCEFEGYAADVTRTLPANGRFTAAQRDLYDCVRAAQSCALEAIQAGRRFDEFHQAAVQRLTEGLRELGLLSGSLDECLEAATYRRFFMHGTGHWLGLDVHDAGTYFDEGTRRRPLEPGMVLTVEPGLYVAEDDDSVAAQFRGLGIRIEDDVLVTENGPELLTAALPKDADDVQAHLAARRAW